MVHAATNLRLCLSLLTQGVLLLANASVLLPGHPSRNPDADSLDHSDSVNEILRYIAASWDTLTRTMTRCESLEDTKTDGEPTLYLPAEVNKPFTLDELQQKCRVRVEHLPQKITGPGKIDLSKIQAEGLLYLENPYVVPGGQFNEMYGWDSYFIVRGLLRDNRLQMAKGMVENFFFEINHYGSILNANRTYYLTRSQPPFLTSMILAVFNAEKSSGHEDLRWLERAYRFAVRDYNQWTEPPHLAGDTGLSRYFDHADGPVPEIMGDPSQYYRDAAYFFLTHDGSYDRFLVREGDNGFANAPGARFPTSACDPGSTDTSQSDCSATEKIALTTDFYKGDRSMRESGFDVTFRFGPFGAETHHYAPVCLNSLLYKTEKDLEQISTLLGHPEDARKWREKSEQRRRRMVEYLWDSSKGEFFDYDFMEHKRSTYEYATTFYPLWAGLASKEQAQAVVGNLHLFEHPGGLAMSRVETRAQWDLPYGWAPVHLLAVEGLRRYGYKADADRISTKFLSMILDNFEREHNIREKYNVLTRSSETDIVDGYTQNFTGFGWTNAVFLELLHESPRAAASLRAH